jgi:CubicO group peptidase (beta-lactamase class C family)
MKSLFLLVLVASVALASRAADSLQFRPDPAAAGFSPKLLARIPTRLQTFVDEDKAAGMVTLVARHGRVASMEAVGFQDRESKTPMRTDTIFQILSLTKPMTCAAVMTLVDEGRIAVIDPVEKYLPEFKNVTVAVVPANGEVDPHTSATQTKPSRPITLHDLMTHTSGLINDPPRGFKRGEHTLAELVSAVAKEPLRFEPGSKWAYSSMGLATLGRIIEVVSGRSYEDFMAERIFVPLGMRDTHFFLPAEKENRLAALYTQTDAGLVRSERDRFRRGAKAPQPDAGLYSTASDVARFFQMMLNRGVLDGQRVLSPAAVETMTMVHTGDLKAGFFPGCGFGLGVAVVREPIGTYRYHSIGSYGHGGGFRCYGWADPSKDLIGVFLCQRTNGGGDMADEMNAFMALTGAAIE